LPTSRYLYPSTATIFQTLTKGGAFLGNNLGAISGLLASLRTLRTLPDPNRVLAMIKEAQLRLVSVSSFFFTVTFFILYFFPLGGVFGF